MLGCQFKVPVVRCLHSAKSLRMSREEESEKLQDEFARKTEAALCRTESSKTSSRGRQSLCNLLQRTGDRRLAFLCNLHQPTSRRLLCNLHRACRNCDEVDRLLHLLCITDRKCYGCSRAGRPGGRARGSLAVVLSMDEFDAVNLSSAFQQLLFPFAVVNLSATNSSGRSRCPQSTAAAAPRPPPSVQTPDSSIASSPASPFRNPDRASSSPHHEILPGSPFSTSEFSRSTSTTSSF